MCQPHVSRNEAVRAIAAATPNGNACAAAWPMAIDSPSVTIESMVIARNRLPSPAGTRRSSTCSGVVMMSGSRMRDAGLGRAGVSFETPREEIQHQTAEEEDGDRDLQRVR